MTKVNGRRIELYALMEVERITPEKWRQVRVTYIPLAKAVRDKVIDLKGEDGEWTRGWRVLGDPVSPRRFADVNRDARQYKKTRKASDVGGGTFSSGK